MIVGDFESPETLDRSINSVKKYVDDIYVTVTYSDKIPTKKSKLIILLKKHKAHISYFKWVYDFSAARQFALDQVPVAPDSLVYWQDTDDVLANGESLRSIADEMVERQVSATYFDYWYQVELDEKGEVAEILVKHRRERIIRHDNTWKWVGALHETLIEQKQENLIREFRPECYVVHLPANTHADVNIERNIEILEETAKKQEGKDPRTLIYLAKAYFDKAKMSVGDDRKIYSNLALTLFHDYLEGSGKPGTEDYRPASGWKEERSSAYSYVAEIALLSQSPEIAIQAYLSAITEAPEFPNYYVDLAMAYLATNDYKKAKHWLRVSTAVPQPSTTMITFPRELKTRALEVSFQINLHEGKFDEAVQDCEMLAKILPKDEVIKDRLKTVIALGNLNKACQSAVFLGKYLESVGEPEKVPHLIKSFSKDMEKEKFASEMRHRFNPVRTWEEDELAILCGPGYEEWTPDSIKTGLGGSEEAVVYLSNELKKLGWKVTVYANPGSKAGDFDGVKYEPWYNLNPLDSFNALVLWRAIGFVDVNPRAKFTMLWLHDVPNNPDFTQERVDKVDKIAVLSEYHRSLLRVYKDGEYIPMPDDKVFLTGNGIPELGLETWDGNPKKIIYASSIDRGLVYLLNNWKRVIAEVPEAELHVYYGFEIFDIMHRDNPERMRWKEQVLGLMNQPGIIYHGRVGHEELNKAYNSSGVWAYSTDFTEISCISAMKAQALGAIPVTMTLAALDETVKNGVKIDADITLPEVQVEYADALIKVLKDEKYQERIRKNMMVWARKQFAWSNVAAIWDETMRVWVQNPNKHWEFK